MNNLNVQFQLLDNRMGDTMKSDFQVLQMPEGQRGMCLLALLLCR